MNTEALWFAANAIAAGGVARLAKRYPALPKGALPWLALLVGYLMALAKFAALDGLPLADAAAKAVSGLGAGLVAVGGHEALKPGLARVIGEDRATFVLGKLPPPKAPSGGKARMLLLAALAMPVLLTGCPAAMQVAAAVSQAASWMGDVLKLADDGAGRYFARHPNAEREARVAGAMSRARKSAEALKAGADDATRGDALAALMNLRAVLDEYKIPQAVAPDGGAETEAPLPQPFNLPTADEARAKLAQ